MRRSSEKGTKIEISLLSSVSRTTDHNGRKREIFLVMIMIVITNDKMTEIVGRWSRSIYVYCYNLSPGTMRDNTSNHLESECLTLYLLAPTTVGALINP